MGPLSKARAASQRMRFLLLAFLFLSAGCGKQESEPKAKTLGLSAYFIDSKGNAVDESNGQAYVKSHLRVEGQVYKDGAPVPRGAAKIRVASDDAKIDQSLFVPLSPQGNFVTPLTTFSGIHPGPALTVAVEVTSPAGTEPPTIIELNSRSKALKIFAIISSIVVLIATMAAFTAVFTGRESTWSNKWAIRFSYLVIVLFLGIPIIAPGVLLHFFPGAVDGMIGYPAGLVVTRIGEPPHDNAQWALNIGGYSHICVSDCLEKTDPRFISPTGNGSVVPNAPSASSGATALPQTGASGGTAPLPAGAASSSGATAAKAPAAATEHAARSVPRSVPPGASSPASTCVAVCQGAPSITGATGTTGSSAVTGACAASTPCTKVSSTAASAGTGIVGPTAESNAQSSSEADKPTVASRDSSPSAPMNPVEDILHPERLDPPIVKVEGGLVIPLYVIILSVIGGAINMTRKVPGFQQEGESDQYRMPEDIEKDQRSHDDENRESQKEFGDRDSLQETATTAAGGQATPAPAGNGPSAETIEQRAQKIDSQLDPLVAIQLARITEESLDVPRIRTLVNQMQDLFARNTEPKLLGFLTYDEWFVSRPRLRRVLGGTWRVELLNQYMYLISAPFLAIVTYYLLDLLGLSKSGVVVVLSFSVGLISEKIVTWILGIASGYMQTSKAQGTAP